MAKPKRIGRNRVARNVWRSHFGEIPKDSMGRSYEIHHKDRNPNNNSIDNLEALSIEEHYIEHLNAKEYGACFAISKRMSLSPEEIKFLASKVSSNRMWITNGINDKRIHNDESIPNGWVRGRTGGRTFGKRSEEFSRKMSEVMRGKNKGPRSKETKTRISETLRSKNASN
jgi:hypothetical protein